MRSLAKRLWSEEAGAIAPIFALALPALIVAGGLAFDYARLAGLDSELQNAADQAALAAASQLTGTAAGCDNAINAARNLLKRPGETGNESGNETLFANDGSGLNVTIGTQGAGCVTSSTDPIRFYTTADGTTLATNAANADFVEVTVAARTARYALTPIVAAFNSGAIDAKARAGLGSAICKVPPLMICNPKPSEAFNADAKKGWGIMVTGHGNDRSGTGTASSAWAPGDFGFLEAGTGSNADLIKALAFESPAISCLQQETGQVNTGNPQGLYDAINTRFDIYDFSSGNGTTLSSCFSGSCPPALNVTKDLLKADTSTNGNSCKIHNSGWKLPTNQFSPRARLGSDTALTPLDSDSLIDAMGLPRDNCHYASYATDCGNDTSNRFGTGNWARGDYFNKYHSGSPPSNAATITRYETYLWEINNGGTSRIPNNIAANPGSGSLYQYGRPVCRPADVPVSTRDRRVLSVAVVDNCSSLSGSSTAAVIGEWVDMFFVEPTIDTRGNGSTKDMIYMEIIGKTLAGGNGSTTAQTVRRDSPYLVQ